MYLRLKDRQLKRSAIVYQNLQKIATLGSVVTRYQARERDI